MTSRIPVDVSKMCLTRFILGLDPLNQTLPGKKWTCVLYPVLAFLSTVYICPGFLCSTRNILSHCYITNWINFFAGSYYFMCSSSRTHASILHFLQIKRKSATLMIFADNMKFERDRETVKQQNKSNSECLQKTDKSWFYMVKC